MKVSVNILAEKMCMWKKSAAITSSLSKSPVRTEPTSPCMWTTTPATPIAQREGDYRCTYEEYQAMVRNADVQSPDMHLVRGMGLEALNSESVRSLRQRMKLYRPGHMWERLGDEAFLQKSAP